MEISYNNPSITIRHQSNYGELSIGIFLGHAATIIGIFLGHAVTIVGYVFLYTVYLN